MRVLDRRPGRALLERRRRAAAARRGRRDRGPPRRARPRRALAQQLRPAVAAGAAVVQGAGPRARGRARGGAAARRARDLRRRVEHALVRAGRPRDHAQGDPPRRRRLARADGARGARDPGARPRARRRLVARGRHRARRAARASRRARCARLHPSLPRQRRALHRRRAPDDRGDLPPRPARAAGEASRGGALSRADGALRDRGRRRGRVQRGLRAARSRAGRGRRGRAVRAARAGLRLEGPVRAAHVVAGAARVGSARGDARAARRAARRPPLRVRAAGGVPLNERERSESDPRARGAQRQPDVSVVVPVFNNESTLDALIDRIVAALEPTGASFEMVMVDDGSRDGSLALLLRRAERDARLRVYAMLRNFGGQSAICAGFDRVRGRRAVCLDADLENHPEDVPKLLAKLDEGYDLVCGVRENRRDPWLTRRVPSAFMNWYVRRQTGRNVRDIGCGLRAMDSSILKNLASEGERRRLVTPMLLRRAHAVAEVPIGHTPSSLRLGHSFLTLLGIAADYYLLTARRPFLVAGLLALAATLAGVAVGLAALLQGSASLGIASLILAAGGLLGGLLSLVGDYVQRVYQLGQGLPFYVIREDVGAAAESAGDDARAVAAPRRA
ncbi:MAG: hypothetical protein DCC71_12560 [Proteobacteria bacterium]|nr:MAG: hypothetical protein DCC71_12560 [Pseudomonadota bacterium]